MSLPHFPSKYCRGCPNLRTRGKTQYWRCKAEGNFWGCIKRRQERKKEHEKLDAKREQELKETTDSYLALFKTNFQNCNDKNKLKTELKKLRKEQKEFFEWLENSGLLIESFETEYKKYLKKKEALL